MYVWEDQRGIEVKMDRFARYDSSQEQQRALDRIKCSGKSLRISLEGKRTLSPVELRFIEKATRIARSGRQRLSIHAGAGEMFTRPAGNWPEHLVDRHEVAHELARFAAEPSMK